MEYNKDESFRCLEIARKHLGKGDKGMAVKFIEKSKRLYPLKEADELLQKLSSQTSNGSVPNGHAHHHTASASNGVRNRASHSQESSTTAKNYTQDQVDAVNRIKKCKDYYEILGVTKNCDEALLKKKYKKLALQFHPDKNQAPGASEAFKAIGNAYSVLNDPEKRRKYNLYGTNDTTSYRRQSSSDWDYSHGFESDYSAEEIFNMFFGNVAQTQRQPSTTAHTFRRFQHSQQENWPQLLMQLSPVFVLILLFLLSMTFVSESPYSFSENSRYNMKRHTVQFKVPYYVKQDFSYSGISLHSLERDIESIYIQNLRQECYKEKIFKESQLKKARLNNNEEALKKVNSMVLLNCQKLEEMYTV